MNDARRCECPVCDEPANDDPGEVEIEVEYTDPNGRKLFAVCFFDADMACTHVDTFEDETGVRVTVDADTRDAIVRKAADQ